MLTPSEAGAYFDEHLTRSAFRLEALDHYEVASDGEDFARHRAGEPEPTWERKDPWLKVLREEKAAGIRRYRVRVLTTPLNDYIRFECEWGYVLNSRAGEEIHVLDLAEHPLPPEVVDHDFWLLDDLHPLRMHYSERGEFIGIEVVPEALDDYRKARDALLAAAEPFERWWARHPEERREKRSR